MLDFSYYLLLIIVLCFLQRFLGFFITCFFVALLYLCLYLIPVNQVTSYTSAKYQFTIYQTPSSQLVFVAPRQSLSQPDYDWIGYLRRLPLVNRRSCLIATHTYLWSDHLLFKLPSIFLEQPIFSTKLYQPQLTTSCDSINARHPNIVCQSEGFLCHCTLDHQDLSQCVA